MRPSLSLSIFTVFSVLTAPMPSSADFEAGFNAYQEDRIGDAVEQFEGDWDARSQYYLGKIYQRGLGVIKSKTRALNLFYCALTEVTWGKQRRQPLPPPLRAEIRRDFRNLKDEATDEQFRQALSRSCGHIQASLKEAIRECSPAGITGALKAGANLRIGYDIEDEDNFFEEAVRKSCLHAVERFLSAGIVPEGSFLLDAILDEQWTIATMLVQHGAPPNAQFRHAGTALCAVDSILEHGFDLETVAERKQVSQLRREMVSQGAVCARPPIVLNE